MPTPAPPTMDANDTNANANARCQCQDDNNANARQQCQHLTPVPMPDNKHQHQCLMPMPTPPTTEGQQQRGMTTMTTMRDTGDGWMTTTPLPASSAGGSFFICLIHSPFPCTSCKVGDLFFIYHATYMLAHRPLPVRSFILGLEYYYLIYINSV